MSSNSEFAVSFENLARLSKASQRVIAVARRLNELAQSTSDEQVRGIIIAGVHDLLETVDDANLVIGQASERTVRIADF